jgi:thiol-disulfide isomerase/thioredoxin
MLKKLIHAWKRCRERYWLSLGMDVVLLLTLLLLVHGWQTRNLATVPPAEETGLARLDGSGRQAIIQPGSQGVVYFFAPWCIYCKSSIDNLDGLLASGAISWANAVALDYRDADEVLLFAEETGIEMPVLMGSGKIARDWSVTAFPTYFVIDAEGQIKSRSVGYSTWLGLRLRVADWF